MAVQVVCISRTLGALGEEVGSLVAERLSFQYVDEQVIERAARLARVDPKLVEAAEHRQPLLRRLMQKLAAARDVVEPATTALALGPLLVGVTERAALRATPEDLRLLIQEAIQELAQDGHVVILAHASSMTLATRTDIVRVLVTASVETRARRLVAAQGVTAEEAAAAVATSDRDRGDYFRRFYDVAQEQPTHYDLVINTDVLTPERAADLIVCAARGGA
ncbi:MAG TPA: cytidylate kinase-like family protein [Candidatus Dormibacteraeota bacterium]|nr:cytidylate kinase-like family protein [Candidatus Dormibacteraeota bacterium]